MKEASIDLGMRSNNIASACERRGNSMGYKWMYKEDYDIYIREKNKLLI